MNFTKVWRKLNKTLIAIGRKRVTSNADGYATHAPKCKTSSGADKGNFVIYTVDQTRFVIPLDYLCHGIFQVLFKRSEEKYGHSSDGPITLPCDAIFMEYAILLIERGVGKGLEKDLLSFPTDSCSLSSSFLRIHASQQLLICCSQNRMYWH